MKKADDGIVKNKTGATSSLKRRWQTTDWAKAEGEVKRLQIRIAEAANRGKENKVKSLQRKLTRSFSARLLAVKRVSSSRGSSTSGIDREVWNTHAKKMEAALSLYPKEYKARPQIR